MTLNAQYVISFQVQEVENCIYYVIEGMKNETKINALYRRVSKYYFTVCCFLNFIIKEHIFFYSFFKYSTFLMQPYNVLISKKYI